MKRVWFRVGMEADITESDWRALCKCVDGQISKNYKGQYVSSDPEISKADIERAVEIMHNMIISGMLSGETYIPEEFGDNRYANEMEINFEF